MNLSIIIPTMGRKNEVFSLLESIYLSNLDWNKTEIIIIDQNFSNILDDVCLYYSNLNININHIKVDFRGLSKAKNYGINQAKGEYICFFDDDSKVYPETINIALSLLNKENYDVVCGKCIDNFGNDSVKLFAKTPSLLSIKSFENKFIEATMFFKTNCIKDYLYDETLGIGAFHGAEEGFDIVYRMLKNNVNIYYDPCILFYHPQTIQNHTSNNEIRRVFTYRCGFAKLCMKHKFRKKFISRLITVSLYIPYLLVFNRKMTRYYCAEFLGLLSGITIK